MRALVLDDDVKLLRFLGRALTEEGFAVDECTAGVDAVALATRCPYDLLVLDWILPDLDGLSVCRHVRAAGITSPLLMLSARRETGDRIVGLSAGADDYVAKPFELGEFLARVRALLRRAGGLGHVRCGELELDTSARQAKVGGLALQLTGREYTLLLHLALRAGYVVERAELLARIWGTDRESGSNVVEVHVGRLRQKLGPFGWMIQSVRSLGYRLIATRHVTDRRNV